MDILENYHGKYARAFVERLKRGEITVEDFDDGLDEKRTLENFDALVNSKEYKKSMEDYYR